MSCRCEYACALQSLFRPAFHRRDRSRSLPVFHSSPVERSEVDATAPYCSRGQRQGQSPSRCMPRIIYAQSDTEDKMGCERDDHEPRRNCDPEKSRVRGNKQARLDARRQQHRPKDRPHRLTNSLPIRLARRHTWPRTLRRTWHHSRSGRPIQKDWPRASSSAVRSAGRATSPRTVERL